ncbi:hypothetical protein [Chryseobacterium sp. 3008163]|uniref:hypothetical protein n=1 Tax=Chryseobacterium sp. 3008163 TaxID=2478663 RepID=UPI000F0C226D|nr:hypothetical protein [Chryseobacterium sp. 3008163]AYN00622.1 hypothetical protein EAG08_10115 [Chryseobacterium sp. 3008163]
MAKRTKSELKNYFQAGKRPTESQFGDFIDSYIHLDVSDLAYGEAGTNTLNRDNAGASGEGVRSGFHQTSSPINYPAGASSWWHLLDVRHSNVNNNYAMQVAGSFYDQDLWYRKTSNDATQAWRKIIAAEPNGNVGIGTVNPEEKLDVNGGIRSTIASNEGGYINISNPSKPNDSAATWRIYNMTGQYGNSLQFWNYFNDGTYGCRLQISDYGNMALFGKLEAKDVVISPTPTADFVFDTGYNLKTISDLEYFITKHKHLPEIPSAKEMEKNGLAVGDFQIKLLQKIEELTLYAISQNKEIEQLKSQINKQ